MGWLRARKGEVAHYFGVRADGREDAEWVVVAGMVLAGLVIAPALRGVLALEGNAGVAFVAGVATVVTTVAVVLRRRRRS